MSIPDKDFISLAVVRAKRAINRIVQGLLCEYDLQRYLLMILIMSHKFMGGIEASGLTVSSRL